MPVLEDDVLLFEAVEDDEMVEPVGAGKGGLADGVTEPILFHRQ